LNQTLKQQVGLEFEEILQEVRIRNSCALLLSSEMQINDIGFSVGFDSTKTFFRFFKKLKGVPVGEYRKVHQAVESCASTRHPPESIIRRMTG
jgi:YesN/AraC family two-component response regulator